MVSTLVSAPYVIAGSTHEFSLQACSNVTLEEVAVLGECCPSGRDLSLNLLVFVFISGAVLHGQPVELAVQEVQEAVQEAVGDAIQDSVPVV